MSIVQIHTDKAPPRGDKDKFSTVARNSSTDADIGADPLFNGFISTCIFRSRSSLSESLSESESKIRKYRAVIQNIYQDISFKIVPLNSKFKLLTFLWPLSIPKWVFWLDAITVFIDFRLLVVVCSLWWSCCIHWNRCYLWC